MNKVLAFYLSLALSVMLMLYGKNGIVGSVVWKENGVFRVTISLFSVNFIKTAEDLYFARLPATAAGASLKTVGQNAWAIDRIIPERDPVRASEWFICIF